MQLVDETESDLVQLIEADFGPIRGSGTFDKHFLSWLHYRARMIPQRPRNVTVSTEVNALASAYPAIRDIHRQLALGDDVSPWLSDRVRKRRQDHRADLMFNDWQIVHLHLGRFFEKPKKVKRSGPLLFAYIGRDTAVLLDVLPHKPEPWACQHLLRILFARLLQSWNVARCEASFRPANSGQMMSCSG
jgi:hypothetical protein